MVGAALPLPAAVFFDMDGLLVDTEPIWLAAEHDVMDSLGAPWGPEHQNALVGGSMETTVAYMIEIAGHGDAAQLESSLLAEMTRRLATEHIDIKPGALELLDALAACDIPTALVSASFRAQMDQVLDHVGPERFTTTVAGDEVARRKPAPDGYLLAAQRLFVRPQDCVVLEDSLNGSLSGQAAGCLVITVPSVVEVPPAPGRLVRRSLAELTPASLATDLAEELARGAPGATD